MLGGHPVTADQQCMPPVGGGRIGSNHMDVLRRISSGSIVAATVGLLVTVVGAGVKFG
jgi:hypothetical protein